MDFEWLVLKKNVAWLLFCFHNTEVCRSALPESTLKGTWSRQVHWKYGKLAWRTMEQHVFVATKHFQTPMKLLFFDKDLGWYPKKHANHEIDDLSNCCKSSSESTFPFIVGPRFLLLSAKHRIAIWAQHCATAPEVNPKTYHQSCGHFWRWSANDCLVHRLVGLFPGF